MYLILESFISFLENIFICFDSSMQSTVISVLFVSHPYLAFVSKCSSKSHYFYDVLQHQILDNQILPMYFSVHLKIPVVLAGIMVLVSCYLVLAPIIDKPELEYLYCTIFIFSGLILYYPFVYRKVNWGRKIMSKFTFLTVKM